MDQRPQKKSDYLIFSSFGDNSNVDLWQEGRQFDLWLAYYGDQADKLGRVDCEYFIHRKGAKFPNFAHIFATHRELILQYKAIMIADDDLVISGNALNQLFDIFDGHDLSLAQPAFDIRGKVSHRVTREHPLSFMRFVNFVEVTCPVFKPGYLNEFMQQYDDKVVGWGADWWYSHMVEKKDGKGNSIAVIDAVTCLNPFDRAKTNGREIDRLQSKAKRIAVWSSVKQENNLDIDETPLQYSKHRSWNIVRFGRFCYRKVYWLFQRLLMKSGLLK